MRGDSLRDLYAKVIAVAGLGVLACAGALVDYWPSAGNLPRVAAEARKLTLAGPLPVPAVSTVAAPMLRPASTRAARIQPPVVTTPEPSAITIADASVPYPTSLQTDTPPPVTASLPVEHHIDLARSTAVALASPPAAPEPLPVASASLDDAPIRFAPPATLADESDGFFSGAVKKTRDSIVRTGRITGASIFDAFRFVGGKMKKALPGT